MKAEKLKDITFLEADLNYTIFHYQNGKKEVHAYTLKKFEELFKEAASFSRIHRKYLVNSIFVENNNGKEITLKCGRKLPISRSKRVKVNA